MAMNLPLAGNHPLQGIPATDHALSGREAIGPSSTTQQSLATSPSSDQALLLRAEQIKAVYQPRQRMSLVALLAGTLLAVGMSREIPIGILAAWFLMLCMAQAYILYLYLRYKREAPPPEQAEQWGNRLLGAMLIVGCAWGSAGILLFEPEMSAYQMFLIFGLFTVAMSTMAGGLTAHMPMVYAFALPTVTPLLVRMIFVGDFMHLTIAASGIVLVTVVLYYAAHLNRLIKESIDIRFENLQRLRENERLLAALERERQQVLTARDRAEAASRAKSRFLAAASHDLRQPLHTLSLYSAALKLAPDDAKGQIAGHIDKALASLSVLVNSLLDISKLDAGAVQPEVQHINIRSVIERIEADYQPIAREKGLQFHVAAIDAFVRTDAILLERLLRNLVDNAFKYTAAGAVTLVAQAGETTVGIGVHDTGAGIPAGERERIFEEFYQIANPERDRSQGLGLGLAIVRRLADLLGLKLELESEPGRGSAFSVNMLRETDTGAALVTSAAAVATHSRGLDGVHVVVIDDEVEVRAGMKTLLEYLGCRAVTCGGIDEAERLLDGGALAVDMIIADFRLRQHENGIDTIRRLRERLGDVPALLVSGDTAPERLREAQSSGLPLLHKPVSAEKLTETMLAVLQR
jgi:signal transduction histidine kinase/CheY-like chemotaxis protein